MLPLTKVMPPITTIVALSVSDPFPVATVWVPEAGPASPLTRRVTLDWVDDEA